MKIVKTMSELRKELSDLDQPVGFVPTMGYLHEGHLSLVDKARDDSAAVVVSIFANPSQFAPGEDLDNYPRDIDRDVGLLENAGVDLVWIPTVEVMYPEGYQTWIEMDHLFSVLEGSYRPTHFRGVATVVAKLFNAVGPDKAYFGQKDAQQAAVIMQMVRDLNFQVEIDICPIVREPDGLAMSSRNTYLDQAERLAARCLSRGLFLARDAYQKGERCAEVIKQIVKDEVELEKLAQLQYVSCANLNTLEELENEIQECLVSMAVFVGGTRLIDNIILGM